MSLRGHNLWRTSCQFGSVFSASLPLCYRAWLSQKRHTKKSLQINVSCGKLHSVFCVAQSIAVGTKPTRLTPVTRLCRRRSKPFLIDTPAIRNHRQVSPLQQIRISNRYKSRHPAAMARFSLITGLPAAMGFLIDNLPIRIRPKPTALNENSVSNRPKRGEIVSRPPAT